MRKFSNILKKFLLIGVFAILFLPMIQNTITLRKSFPLKGDVILPANVEFSEDAWFLGDFQQKKEEYLNSMFGFRSLFVKAHNQIAYSFFDKVNAQGVVIGKENYLYEESYLNAYTGKDFLGEDSIAHTINRLKFISDTLNKLGKQLIVVFAAGKASFYPEFIPNIYLDSSSNLEKTNYHAFVNLSNKYKLNYIDFNEYLIKNKSTSPHKLYAKSGIHWSQYASVRCADSAIHGYIRRE